jgi:predicted TIM-barrel fold metal-dependent hydrolase
MAPKASPRPLAIDADGHYLEPPHSLPDYIDPAFRQRAPHIAKKADGKEYWAGSGWWEHNPKLGFAGGQPRRATAVSGLAGVGTWKQGTNLAAIGDLNYTQANPASFDPTARLRVMEKERIDACVLYPTMNLQWIEDVPFHHALNRALNDWQADYVKGGKGRLYGVVNIGAVHDAKWARDEVRRCVRKHGFKALFIRPAHAVASARWWSDFYDPVWQACQELDIAVAFHPFSGDMMHGSARYFDTIGPSMPQQFAAGPINNPVDAMHTLTGLIAGGKLAQYPALRVAFLEAGGGWLVTLLERLDHRYENLGHLLPSLKIRPSEYFKRNGWISFDPEEATLGLTAKMLGADRIIWGSDFPHPDAFYPNFLKMLTKNIRGLGEKEQRQVLGLNAKALYRLP